MVKIALKLSNQEYKVLDQMSKDSGMEVEHIIRLLVIKKIEDYRENMGDYGN